MKRGAEWRGVERGRAPTLPMDSLPRTSREVRRGCLCMSSASYDGEGELQAVWWRGRAGDGRRWKAVEGGGRRWKAVEGGER